VYKVGSILTLYSALACAYPLWKSFLHCCLNVANVASLLEKMPSLPPAVIAVGRTSLWSAAYRSVIVLCSRSTGKCLLRFSPMTYACMGGVTLANSKRIDSQWMSINEYREGGQAACRKHFPDIWKPFLWEDAASNIRRFCCRDWKRVFTRREVRKEGLEHSRAARALLTWTIV